MGGISRTSIPVRWRAVLGMVGGADCPWGACWRQAKWKVVELDSRERRTPSSETAGRIPLGRELQDRRLATDWGYPDKGTVVVSPLTFPSCAVTKAGAAVRIPLGEEGRLAPTRCRGSSRRSRTGDPARIYPLPAPP